MIEISPDKIEDIIKYLNDSKIVAVPTETVYGLAIKYNDVSAFQKLNEIKQRGNNNFSMMIASKSDIENYGILSKRAKRITDSLFPGELTIILPRNPDFKNSKNSLCNLKDEIGIRIPNNKFMLELLSKSGPLLVASANYKGENPCLNSDEVKKNLDFVDIVVSGKSDNKIASSIVKVVDDEVILLREGNISFDFINSL